MVKKMETSIEPKDFSALNEGVEKIMSNSIFTANKESCRLEDSFGYDPELLDSERAKEAGKLLNDLCRLAIEAYCNGLKDLFDKAYRFFSSNLIFSSGIEKSIINQMNRLRRYYLKYEIRAPFTTAPQQALKPQRT